MSATPSALLCCPRRPCRVIVTASSGNSGGKHEHVPKALAKLMDKRKGLEAKRSAQLLKIAKALDAVAREELEVFKACDAQHGGDVDVRFVNDAFDLLGSVEQVLDAL